MTSADQDTQRRGLFLPIFGQLSDPAVLASLAREAEDAGWDGVFVWDHVQYRRPVTHVTDPWIALAAMALSTSSITIGPLVTPLARRRPHIVARQIAAIERLAPGRFVFGAGLGHDAAGELSQFGEETDDRTRAAMLDEGLPLLRALLEGEPVHHAGTYYTALDVQLRPAPSTHVPIWLAARWPNRRPLARAARYDGVFVIDIDDPATLSLVSARVRQERTADGPFDIVVRSQDHTSASRWHAAGATWWLADFDPFSCDAAGVRHALQR